MDVAYGQSLTKEIIRLNGRIEALEAYMRDVLRLDPGDIFKAYAITRKALGEE